MESRGLRNNNPLNIRKNMTKWKGLSPIQSDSAFFQFTAPEWGYRAAFKILQTYKEEYGIKTLRGWISRWAPPCENSTLDYLHSVCKYSNINADEIIDIKDKQKMCLIAAGMSKVENGVLPIISDIEKGYKLAFK